MLICISFNLFPAVNAYQLEDALDFEVGWLSEDSSLKTDFIESDLALSGFSTLADRMNSGAVLSIQNVKSGAYSVRWKNHPLYPTISTDKISGDFSIYNTISFWVYSQDATNEKIFLSILSDNPATAWKDFFIKDFIIDFTGWKQITIAFSEFNTLETPVGFNKVDGVYFHTKIFNNQPNPNTDIYFDNMKFSKNGEAGVIINTPYITPSSKQCALPFNENNFNHSYTETSPQANDTAPITYSPYYKAERAILGYNPKFNPAPVSFNASGKAYLKYGGKDIQTIDRNGVWTRINLSQAIDTMITKTFNYKENYILYDDSNYDECFIRFDNDNSAYLIVTALVVNQGNSSQMVSFLLYSKDGSLNPSTLKTYKLTKPFARFERMDANNTDCLKRPPVITLSQAYVSTNDRAGYILIPQKVGDELALDVPVVYANNCLATAVHSGDANFAITRGDKIYIVYSVLTDANHPLGAKEIIPPLHPANSLTQIRNGVPAFIVSYDITTKVVSDPVFVGYGGHAMDDHNWGAITIDTFGKLHILLNGHHDPTYYISQTTAGDMTNWNMPELFGQGNSYASVVMDKNNTMYVVTRDSTRGYRFDLTMSRKKYGQPWEYNTGYQTKYTLVKRAMPYYEIWKNKISIDPKTGNLYVSYFSQSSQIEMFKDQYDAHLYIYPDREKLYLTNNIVNDNYVYPVGTFKTSQNQNKLTYNPSQSEPVVITSSDGGNTWRLATTNDFNGFYVAVPKFFDESNKELAFIPKEGKINIKWYVSNIKESMTMLIGVKDNNNKLKRIVLRNVTKNEEIIETTLDNLDKKVELYLWNSNLLPLSSKFTFDSNGIK